MSAKNHKKSSQRIFLGLTLLSIFYAVVLVPWLQHRHNEAEDAADLAACIHDIEGPIDSDCMVRAEGLAVIHRTAWHRHFQIDEWLFLLAISAGIPLLIYSSVRLSAASLAGSRSLRSAAPPQTSGPRFHS